jgi:hypothetical protein
VAFYVPLGPRGLIFRLGTFVIGIWGGLVYRLAYRRRLITFYDAAPILVRGYGIHAYTPVEDSDPLPNVLAAGRIVSDIEAAALA